jgi:alkanesulfonate monooxygenase SsuD/methylene tetrahydromethanopterin reductase-like flavin-dependent oxidoreductase (luciferase family)
MLAVRQHWILLAREGPGHAGPLPGLVPLPFPLPGKATRVDVRLAGSPSRVLQLAGRFADAAVVADLQLGRLAGRPELVLGHQHP